MVAAAQARRMSVAEWRDLLRRSSVKYEYSDGWVYAMPGGTANHSRIAVNLTHDLDDALGDGPCGVYNSDMAVRLSPTEYRFPDVSVTCDEHDQGDITEIASPRVLVEVLSDATEREDRTAKVHLYRACPTVEEYAFIITRYRAVEVYRRAGDAWTAEVYVPGETAALNSIDVRLVVDALYRRTDVPEGRQRDAPANGND